MKHLLIILLPIVALLIACGSNPDNDLIEQEIENHYLKLSAQAGIHYTIDDIDINSKNRDATNKNRWIVEVEVSGEKELVQYANEPTLPVEFTHMIRLEVIKRNGTMEIQEIPDYLWKK